MQEFIDKVKVTLEQLSMEAIEQQQVAEYVFEMVRHQVTLAHLMTDPKSAVESLCESIKEIAEALVEET